MTASIGHIWETIASMDVTEGVDRNGVFELRCSVAIKHWGKKGGASEVARLLQTADPAFTPDPDTPYAELWMGTHASGPSTAMVPGRPDTPLADWIRRHPERLGTRLEATPGGHLPFLLKVLSVRKALSIQAHPDKALAEELHMRDPQTYVDSNHKPEMVIALGDFRGMCGFRPIHEVARFLRDIEELRSAVDVNNATKLINASKQNDARRHRDAMKVCFFTLMGRHGEHGQKLLVRIVDRVRMMDKEDRNIQPYVGDVLLQLDRDFPGNVGALAIYFLNVITLHAGEAIFFGPSVPHAYISGDCIECMASSDNVVRAGLTPNFIDLPLFVDMVDFTSRPVNKLILRGLDSVEDGCHMTRFAPPITDFGVTRMKVPESLTSCKLAPMDSASIVICVEGNGQVHSRTIDTPLHVTRGSVLFISANEEVTLQSAGNEMLLFRAHAG